MILQNYTSWCRFITVHLRLRHCCLEADGAVEIGQTHIDPSQVEPSTKHSSLSVQGPPISESDSVMHFFALHIIFFTRDADLLRFGHEISIFTHAIAWARAVRVLNSTILWPIACITNSCQQNYNYWIFNVSRFIPLLPRWTAEAKFVCASLLEFTLPEQKKLAVLTILYGKIKIYI